MAPRTPATLRPPQKGFERATFLELFVDLVFIFAFARIATRASEDLALEPGGAAGWGTLAGGGKTLILLLALWAVWQGTAWTTSRYDPYQVWLQVIVITAIGATMTMGVAVTRAFEDGGLVFAMAYVIAQISRPLILMIALRGDVRRRLKLRMLIIYSATGVLWIVGAMLSVNPRVVLWIAALAIEYVSARIGWAVPGLGRSTTWKWEIGGAHLAERYQQFFLVALGEAVLLTGLAYSRGNITAGRTAAFALALATSILIWRIYVQRAGHILAEAMEKSARPAAIGQSAADTHLVMVVGVIATAIGYQLSIAHSAAKPEPAWAVLILGGPAIFMAGRARFEYEVFARVSRSRLVAIVALAVLFVLMVGAPPLATLAAAVAVLLVVALIDTKRAWGRPPEEPAPPY